MIHVFKSVYLEHDFLFTGKYDFMSASGLQCDNEYLPGATTPSQHSESLDDLLLEHFDNDIENLWEHLFTYDKKIILFLQSDDLLRLMIQFTKSILKNPTPEAVYFLYKTRLESRRLAENFRDSTLRFNRVQFKNIIVKTREEFDVIYNAISPSQFLIDSVDTSQVSFELLLANFIYDRQNKHRQVLLNKLDVISWENWTVELESLKLELIYGLLDNHNLNEAVSGKLSIPQFDISLPLEAQLKAVPELQWLVDPEWYVGNPNYIRNNYDPELFSNLYDAVYSMWDSGEDMSEICSLVVENKPEELLDRDIARKHSCIFTASNYRDKMNYLLCTYIYECERSGNQSDLSIFELR